MKPPLTNTHSLTTFKNHKGQSTRLVKRFIQRLAQCIKCGTLVIHFPDGNVESFEGTLSKTPVVEIQLADYRALRRLLTHGDLGFAEAYMDGEWSCSNLTSLLHLGVLNERYFEKAASRWSAVKIMSRLQHILNNNSRRQARKNISYHYDLGNDFYALWLDHTMTYSAGIFADGMAESETSLDLAQINKYERLVKELEINQSHDVLEIGCGWGGFMEHVVDKYKAQITGVSISREQCNFAAHRLKQLGSAQRSKVLFKDYRDIEGQYDRIVSIEMFEAVGEKYWTSYAEKLKRLLAVNGRAALQIITISEERFDTYKKSADFIQRYIFPGGMLPSNSALKAVLSDAGLQITESFRFGPHYAETLRRWRVNFDNAWPEIQALGFDDRFRRMWHYYLAYCEVGFDTGATDVVQLTLEHA